MGSRNFESRFYFGDKVAVDLNGESKVEGEVIGVSFSESKVFYDVDTKGALLIRMPSDIVEEAPVEEEIG